MEMEKGWHQALKEEFSKPYMDELRAFLKEERKKHNVYPPKGLVFNAFNCTPMDQVRVVIIGQDPYHGEGQAHGLSFSVPKGVAIPPSLRNIYKELVEDVGILMPTSGCLIPWTKQGVFLLNATLTVRAKEPKSHYGKGWEIFTDAVVQKLYERKDPLVFLLWGCSAQEKCFRVFNNSPDPKHLILCAAHPSFYSAAKFFGCKHFSQTNRFLEKHQRKPIDWQIP